MPGKYRDFTLHAVWYEIGGLWYMRTKLRENWMSLVNRFLLACRYGAYLEARNRVPGANVRVEHLGQQGARFGL